jgi:hypothetical protein
MKNCEPLLGLVSSYLTPCKRTSLRVGTSIGHGQQVLLGVGLLEVLIGKLLAVDGLAASALNRDISSALMYLAGDILTLPRVKSPP